MSWNWYIILGFLGGAVFFATGVWALQWAKKNGHLDRLDQGAAVIFDEEEPAGHVTDRFPLKARKKGKK